MTLAEINNDNTVTVIHQIQGILKNMEVTGPKLTHDESLNTMWSLSTLITNIGEANPKKVETELTSIRKSLMKHKNIPREDMIILNKWVTAIAFLQLAIREKMRDREHTERLAVISHTGAITQIGKQHRRTIVASSVRNAILSIGTSSGLGYAMIQTPKMIVGGLNYFSGFVSDPMGACSSRGSGERGYFAEIACSGFGAVGGLFTGTADVIDVASTSTVITIVICVGILLYMLLMILEGLEEISFLPPRIKFKKMAFGHKRKRHSTRISSRRRRA